MTDTNHFHVHFCDSASNLLMWTKHIRHYQFRSAESEVWRRCSNPGQLASVQGTPAGPESSYCAPPGCSVRGQSCWGLAVCSLSPVVGSSEETALPLEVRSALGSRTCHWPPFTPSATSHISTGSWTEKQIYGLHFRLPESDPLVLLILYLDWFLERLVKDLSLQPFGRS